MAPSVRVVSPFISAVLALACLIAVGQTNHESDLPSFTHFSLNCIRDITEYKDGFRKIRVKAVETFTSRSLKGYPNSAAPDHRLFLPALHAGPLRAELSGWFGVVKHTNGLAQAVRSVSRRWWLMP